MWFWGTNGRFFPSPFPTGAEDRFDIAGARLRFTTIGVWLTLLVILALPAALVESPYAALALIGLAMFAIQAKASNLFALPADLFPAGAVGTSWGLFGAVGAFGGMAFAAFAGSASQQVGYAPVFVAVGVTQLLSAVFISWLIPVIVHMIGFFITPGGNSLRLPGREWLKGNIHQPM